MAAGQEGQGGFYAGRPWYHLWPYRVPKNFAVPDVSCADVFRESARLYPKKTALVYFDTRFTYAELDELTDRFAAFLKDLGVGKGDRVALYMQNIPAYVIAEYGCWKRGAVVVPMNPMLKEREIEYLLQDCTPRLMVCEEGLYPTVRGVLAGATSVQEVITTSPRDWYSFEGEEPGVLKGVEKIRFPETLDFRELLERYAKVEPDVFLPVGGGDLAAISYTSGTTGVPKGALTSHTNHVANALNNLLWFSLGASDVFFGFVPWFHITGANMQTVLPFLTGGTLVTGYRFEPGLALRQIERYRISHAVGPITMYIAMLNHPGFRKYDLSSLLTPISGGAPVPEAVVARWEKEAGTYIYNVMGLTESTAPLIFVPPGRRAPVDPDTGALSIGIPLPNVEFKVVDAENPDQEVPLGETGEMLVRGPQMVAGYWNKPEETRETFRDGWCHTGDIVKMDREGWIYLVDRKKDMIIVSGYKVWPREVEDVIYRHPATKEVLVVGVPDPYRGESPKAFVSLKEEYVGRVTEREFIDFCRANMAVYKCPREVEFLEEIPKTASGKALRRLLREREAEKRRAGG
jgi:long-chain acyl-CoA synthetase